MPASDISSPSLPSPGASEISENSEATSNTAYALRSDQEYLVTLQYRDASNLNARIALHQRFGHNTSPWQRWVFDQLIKAMQESPPRKGRVTTRVLEIGCGPARLWVENADRIPPDWAITLVDLSAGMVDEARQSIGVAFGPEQRIPFSFTVADAQSLPFAHETFDAVVANHMLYHVPDRTKAISEIRRVLRAGAPLIAATNGEAHLRELDELAARFLPETAGANRHFSEDFTLGNGADQLRASFASVEELRFPGDLEVTEAEPVVAYMASMVAVAPANLLTEERREAIRAYVEQQIATHGAFHITRVSGLFIAR